MIEGRSMNSPGQHCEKAAGRKARALRRKLILGDDVERRAEPRGQAPRFAMSSTKSS